MRRVDAIGVARASLTACGFFDKAGAGALQGRAHLRAHRQHGDAAWERRQQQSDAEREPKERGVIARQAEQDQAVGKARLAHAPAADRNRQRGEKDRHRND
jgi:hypothetical protein